MLLDTEQAFTVALQQIKCTGLKFGGAVDS